MYKQEHGHPSQTRQNLVDQLARHQESPEGLPMVCEPELLLPGDMLQVVDMFDHRPFKRILVTGVTRHPDEQGNDQTYIAGVEADMDTYHEYTNNPEKLAEFATLTGRNPQNPREMAELTGAMATEAVVKESDQLAISEVEATSIGVAPYANGSYHPSVATYLAAAAQ